MKIFQKIFGVLVSVLLTFSGFLGAVNAQPNKEITVFVKDENNNGVPAINITLIGPNGYTNTIATSTTNGSAIFDDLEDNGEYTATVSIPSSSNWKMKTGETTSQSVEITNANDSETITFLVVKKDSVEEANYKILETTLPAAFTKVGSTSTILSTIKISDIPAVKNFTLDDPSANKIIFLQELNLSENALADKFAELDKYASISETGRVSLDSESLPELNKKAQITMRGLNLVSGSVPTIVEDGRATTKVSNIKYNNQVLTFDVAGFSNYAFRPTLKIEAPEDTTEPTLTIQGEVDDIDSLIDIYLGEERIAEELEPEDDGAFVFSYTLQNKENKFKVIASSENGEVAEVEFETIFEGGVQSEAPAGGDSISFLLILAIVGGLAAVGFAVYYFIKKNKQNKLTQPKSMGERELDMQNPPMPVVEKEDLMENKINGKSAIDMDDKVDEVGAENRIGKTDLEPIDSHEKD